MKKQIIILVSLMVCIFLLFGCNPAPTTTTHAVTATTPPVVKTTPPVVTTPAVPRSVLKSPVGYPLSKETPQYGGIMKMESAAIASNIGAPWKILSGPNKMYNRFACEYLTSVDIKGNAIPQLATSWVNDPAAKTVTFTLREGVMFHDGTPFNAEAVKWNLDMAVAAHHPSMTQVASIVAVDPTHLKVTLTAWDPLFIQDMSANTASCIVSPTAAKKLIDAGKEADILRNPVGTGPFKFVSMTPDVSIKFEKWTGYWQKGLPYLDGVEVVFVTDPVVALTSFQKKEVQFMEGVQPKDVKTLVAGGFQITKMISAVMGITGDSANAGSPFADIKVRQAICYAIDNKTIVDAAFDGTYVPTNQWAAPGMSAYDSTIKGYPYDVAKAKALLEQVGITTAKPLNVKFTFAPGPQTTDAYTAIQGYLAKVGINLQFDIITGAAWNTFRTKPMTNQMSEFNTSYNGVEYPYSATLKQSIMKNSPWYPSIWTSDAYNALLQQMLPENDLAKREVYYQQLNKMLVDTDCLATPIWLKPNFKGATPDLIDCGMGDMANEFLPEIIWRKK